MYVQLIGESLPQSKALLFIGEEIPLSAVLMTFGHFLESLLISISTHHSGSFKAS